MHINKQLLQLIKILSEQQMEAIYSVKMNNKTTQKQSDNQHSKKLQLISRKNVIQNILLTNNVNRNHLMG